MDDFAGLSFGKLTVLAGAPPSATRKRRWLCVCECGAQRVVSEHNLRDGNSRACGRFPCADRGAKRRYPPGEQAANFIFLNYQSNARQRSRVWTLPRQQFRMLAAMPCHYCGTGPANRTRDRNSTGYSGLDRVDSAAGYTPENVVPACFLCNRAKSNMSAADFLAWACQVAERSKEVMQDGKPLPPRCE